MLHIFVFVVKAIWMVMVLMTLPSGPMTMMMVCNRCPFPLSMFYWFNHDEFVLSVACRWYQLRRCIHCVPGGGISRNKILSKDQWYQRFLLFSLSWHLHIYAYKLLMTSSICIRYFRWVGGSRGERYHGLLWLGFRYHWRYHRYNQPPLTLAHPCTYAQDDNPFIFIMLCYVPNGGCTAGDGVTTVLAVGAKLNDDSGTNCGAVYILFLTNTGLALSHTPLKLTCSSCSLTSHDDEYE